MPRKKTILLSTALAGLVVLGLGGVMVWLSEAGASPEQPIAFSHRQHVENDIHCAFCHPYYEKYDAAGIPRVELCVTCHAFMPQEDPESQKILEYADYPSTAISATSGTSGPASSARSVMARSGRAIWQRDTWSTKWTGA